VNVRELIETLKDFDEDAEVHFMYNYGDHWRTMVCPKAVNVEELPVKWSDYHGKPALAEDDDEEASIVVVLSGH